MKLTGGPDLATDDEIGHDARKSGYGEETGLAPVLTLGLGLWARRRGLLRGRGFR